MWIIIGIIVVLFLILITIIGYADKPQKPVVRPPKEDHRDDWPKSSIKTNTRNYNESSNCCVDKIDSDELIIEFVGKIGEAKVENMLFSIKEKHYSYVFNNYTFMDNDGYSTDIDHIIICNGGIFIIETKSNTGVIYGNEYDDYWLAEKEYEDKEFKNPVKQNQGHINHLRKMFKYSPPKMYSMIIFTEADSISDVESNKVYDLHSAYEFIVNKIKNAKYSNEYIEKMAKEFNDIINDYGISIQEHIQNIKNKAV